MKKGIVKTYSLEPSDKIEVLTEEQLNKRREAELDFLSMLHKERERVSKEFALLYKGNEDIARKVILDDWIEEIKYRKREEMINIGFKTPNVMFSKENIEKFLSEKSKYKITLKVYDKEDSIRKLKCPFCEKVGSVRTKDKKIFKSFHCYNCDKEYLFNELGELIELVKELPNER